MRDLALTNLKLPTTLASNIRTFSDWLLASNREARFLEFLSYFLRLGVKEPARVAEHYANNKQVLLGWANISHSDMELKLDLLTGISQQLAICRPGITLELMDMILTNRLDYELPKKWFASKYEFFGMALCNTLAEIAVNGYDLLTVIRHIRNDVTSTGYFKILVTFAMMCCDDNKLKEHAPLFGLQIPLLSKDDLTLSRFARCINNTYLTWCTTNNNPTITAGLLGVKAGLLGITMKPTLARLMTKEYAWCTVVGSRLAQLVASSTSGTLLSKDKSFSRQKTQRQMLRSKSKNITHTVEETSPLLPPKQSRLDEI